MLYSPPQKKSTENPQSNKIADADCPINPL